MNTLLSCHTHHVFYKKEPDSDVVNEAHHLNSLGDGSYKVPGFASFDLYPFRCVCYSLNLAPNNYLRQNIQKE